MAPPPQPPPPAPPARRRPPSGLRKAADAFFAGDYDEVIRLVSATNYSQRKSRSHALLLRSAARYALFLLGGETDYALRGQAIEDIVACRRTDPDLEPGEDFFSPRFRDFFAGTR